MDLSGDQYVGIGRRLCAHVLDALVVLALTGLSLLLVFMLRTWVSEAFLVLFTIAFFLNGIPVSWLYFAGMESSRFQGTFGKMALKIKVVGKEGERITFGKASLRFFGKLLGSVTLWIGALMIAFTKKKQGLHDKMASTFVVKKHTQIT
jgi:uncharacterized RDD family membrane protein YckC